MRWGLAVVLAALSFVVGGVVGIALDRKHRPKLKNQQRWPSTAADKPPTTDSFQQFYRACRVTFAHNQGAQHKLLQHFEEVFFEAGFDQLRAFALIDHDHDGIISFDDFSELPGLFHNLLSESEAGDFEALFEAMDSSRAGHVTAADWHQSFEAAGEALKKEISHWLHELLISHHGTVIEAFDRMDPGQGVVTVANLKTGLEQMIGVRLQQMDLARILWSLEADVAETGHMPVEAWVECVTAADNQHGFAQQREQLCVADAVRTNETD